MTIFKSNTITGLDSNPPQLASFASHGQFLRIRQGSVQLLGIPAAAHELRFFRVHSRDIPCFMFVLSDSIPAGNDWDFGLYETNEGSVVDADLFAATLAMDGITNSDPEFLQLPGFAEPAGEAPIWQQLGLASDPNQWYDFVCTATFVGTMPDINLVVQYFYTEGA